MRKFAPALLVLLLCGCTTLPTNITATWFGTYEVVDKTLVASSKSPTGVTLATEAAGKSTAVTGQVEGSRLDARVGYGFGVIYRIPTELQDSLKAIVRVPAPGIPDKRSGKLILESEWKPNCSDTTCRALYNFEHESELIPGVWRLELWQKGTMVLSHEFTLAK